MGSILFNKYRNFFKIDIHHAKNPTDFRLKKGTHPVYNLCRQMSVPRQFNVELTDVGLTFADLDENVQNISRKQRIQ